MAELQTIESMLQTFWLQFYQRRRFSSLILLVFWLVTEKSKVKYLVTVLSITCDRIVPTSGPFGYNRNACDRNDPDSVWKRMIAQKFLKPIGVELINNVHRVWSWWGLGGWDFDGWLWQNSCFGNLNFLCLKLYWLEIWIFLILTGSI